MNRIQQLDPARAAGKTRQLFESIKSEAGAVSNGLRVVGNSPAALEGFLKFRGALSSGVLPARLREQIALTVAEINGCGYCLSARSQSARRAGLSKDEIDRSRRATAGDDKADAALKLARSVALLRGRIACPDLAAARKAGLSEEEIVEIVANVAINTFTNYMNTVAETVIDYPEVKPGVFAAPAHAAFG